MKITVLDGFTLNPGDLSWAELRTLGECTIHDRTSSEEVLFRAAGAEIVLVNKVRLREREIGRLPGLKYVGVLATGTDVIDLEAARARGILVTNVPAYGTRSVAQTTFALLLELCHHVGHHARTVREGSWQRSPDWCYWERPLIELDGLTLGIVGYGRIGRAVGELGAAFGMRLLVHTPRPAAEEGRTRFTDLETLLRESDVLTLHCPLTPQTTNLINAARLSLMKPTAFLLNTSRGGLVDAPALANALNDGRLAGAGLDVLAQEPPVSANPLLTARNCLITPHLSWATNAARKRLLNIATENVRAFLRGTPQNVIC